MKVGLDTSVVLQLLVDQPADQWKRAIDYLDRLSRQGDRPVVSDLVVAETFFALHYHYDVPKKEALASLHHMFCDGEIEPVGAAALVLAMPGLATAKLGFIDRLIHHAYTTDGGAMATFEQSAKKLPSVHLL